MLGKSLNNDLHCLDCEMINERWQWVNKELNWKLVADMREVVVQLVWWNIKEEIEDEIFIYRRIRC